MPQGIWMITSRIEITLLDKRETEVREYKLVRERMRGSEIVERKQVYFRNRMSVWVCVLSIVFGN